MLSYFVHHTDEKECAGRNASPCRVRRSGTRAWPPESELGTPSFEAWLLWLEAASKSQPNGLCFLDHYLCPQIVACSDPCLVRPPLLLKVEAVGEWWPCLTRAPALNTSESELSGEQCECSCRGGCTYRVWFKT